MRFGLLSGGGPRAEGFAAALEARGHPSLRHVTYQQFIQNQAEFKDLLSAVDILRIDSPGGGYDIWKCFADYLGISTSPYDNRHGLIYPQTPLERGTYECIKAAYDLAAAQGVKCTVDPQAVQRFMDKSATHKLSTPTIPTPEALPDIRNWEELQSAMLERGLTRVFMKLRYGSAASGVLAIEVLGQKLRLWTTKPYSTASRCGSKPRLLIAQLRLNRAHEHSKKYP